MRPQDLASVVRGAHTLTPAIKCCLRHMPALALRRYAIPLKTYACAKTLQKAFPATAIKCAACFCRAFFGRPRKHTLRLFLRRFADNCARCLPVPLINEACHAHWENNTTALVQVGKCEKMSTCPAKHTNGILTALPRSPAICAQRTRCRHYIQHTLSVARRLFMGRKLKAHKENCPQTNNPHKKNACTLSPRVLWAPSTTHAALLSASLCRLRRIGGAEKQHAQQELSNARRCRPLY